MNDAIKSINLNLDYCYLIIAKKSILIDSGYEWNNLIDITVFLTDMKNDFKIFNKIYSQYFINGNCCRTTLEVNALPTDIAIELKCKAIKGKTK